MGRTKTNAIKVIVKRLLISPPTIEATCLHFEPGRGPIFSSARMLPLSWRRNPQKGESETT
ncbi:hypothetical protein FB464_2098 [Subtercola boreus]|nr:hypothetical protein FB464_2098 [Subtercola boreus]